MTLAWRPLLTMGLCAAAGALVGLFFAQRTPYKFRVEAEVLVMLGRETSKTRSDILAAGGPKGPAKPPDYAFVNGEIALLRSPWVLRETVESMARDVPGFHEMTLAGSGDGLFGSLASFGDSVSRTLDLAHDTPLVDRSILEWQDRLEINVSIRTDVIEVGCYVADARLGEAFLTRLLEKYEEAHVLMHTQALAELTLAHELEALREREIEAEAALRRFNVRTGVLDYPAAFSHLIARRRNVEQRARGLAVDQAATAASIERAHELLKTVPPTSVGRTMTRADPTTDFLKGEVVRRRQLEGKEAREMLDERAVERAHEKTEIARSLLEGRSELRESSNVILDRDPVHGMLSRSSVESEIRAGSIESERAEVERTLRELRSELTDLEALQAEYIRLTDELGDVRADLGLMARADQVARLGGVLEEAGLVNVRVINPPKSQIRPERLMGRDHRVAVTMGWAIAGFALAAAYYALRSALRDELLASRGFLRREDQTS